MDLNFPTFAWLGYLRAAVLAGQPGPPIARSVEAIGIHPLAVALAPDPSVQPGRVPRQAVQAENRKVAEALGMRSDLVEAVRSSGLRFRDKREVDLPDRLLLRSLVLSRGVRISRWPLGLRLGRLKIHQCHAIESLPSSGQARSIEVLDCRGLRSVCQLMGASEVRLAGLPLLEELPDSFHGETLHLQSCPRLECLPGRLKADSLTLIDLPRLSRWPSRYEVVSRPTLKGCPGLLKSPPWQC